MKQYTYENYQKLQDQILFISKNLTLNFNLNLFSFNEKKGRSYFHSEVQYMNTKFNEKVINIKRRFDSYLSFENITVENGYKAFIMIRTEELIETRRFFLSAFDSLFDHQKDIYKIEGKKTRLLKEPTFVLDNLAQGASIALKPILVDTIETGIVPGVRMFLSSKDHFADFPLRKLSAIAENINKANLYLYGSIAMAYVGRPEYGTGLIDLARNFEEETTGVPGRKIPGPTNKNKSFFDKK